MKRMLALNMLRVATYAALIALALACQWGQLSTHGTPDVVHAMIFTLGPVCLLLDMHAPMNTTLRAHHGETVLRIGLLVWSYTLVMPGTEAFLASPGLMANAFNVGAMFVAVLFWMHQFAIVPVAWIGKYFLPRFLVVVLIAMAFCLYLELGFTPRVEGQQLWCFALPTMVALHLAWRHALWHNPSQEMSLGQHASMWAKLQKDEPPNDFWKTVAIYSFKHPTQMPDAALAVLNFPTLLGYFNHQPCNVQLSSQDVLPRLERSVKAAITAKEPRAVFIWEMYGNEDAVRCIQRLNTPESLQTQRASMDSIELPVL